MNLEVSVEDRRRDVEAWLKEPGRGEPVKESRVRSVHRWNGLFVKRFRHEGFIQHLRALVSDPAAHEYRILGELRRRGIAVPEPVAWARQGDSTYLFTREIPQAAPLGSIPLTRALLGSLARFARGVHDAGLLAEDLHLGNVLLAGGQLHLVDLHQSRIVRQLSPQDRLRSVAFLIHSFYTLVSQTEVFRFVRIYGADPAGVWPAFQEVRHRYYRSRQSRAWKTGTGFQVSGDLILRRPYTEEAARRALSAPPLRRVKEIPNRRLWLADPATFVKEGSRAAWSNGFGLEVRGIPTPRLFAVQGDRVVGEWLEGALPLWDHLQAHGVSRELLGRLARLVRRMHVRGVYHRDLKANNILVRGGELYVVDLDRVDFVREVPPEDRAWNLAQLNAAVGAPVSRTERLRFFFAYCGRSLGLRREWKRWVAEIYRNSVARRHHWPPR